MTDEEILELTIKTIEDVGGYPVFPIDMSKYEVEKNSSFFIYHDKGPIRKAEKPNQFLRDFILSFITTEGIEIDEFALIIGLRKCGLIFRETEHDYGKFQNTDVDAKMTTFNLHKILLLEY